MPANAGIVVYRVGLLASMFQGVRLLDLVFLKV